MILETGVRAIRYLDISPLGDHAVLVKLGDKADLDTHKRVQILSRHLADHPFAGMVEFVPAFTTVAVYYDPAELYLHYRREYGPEKETVPYLMAVEILKGLLARLEEDCEIQSRVVEIPVCYGGEFGPDLQEVAKMTGLTPEEVIEIHSSGDYLVHMIGFAPGFPYLGGMSKRIAAPRRSTPRLSIPAGTVGIAGEQTGIYPIETPGGWQLIGRTPLKLFLPEREPPTLLETGNRVRFYPISREEYERWKRDVR